MNRWTKIFNRISIALLTLSIIVCSGCGSGDSGNEDQARTTTVAKVMVPTFFGLPEPGASMKEINALSAAGVKSSNITCGSVAYRDANGGALMSHFPTFVVLAKIQPVDVNLTKEFGFVETTPLFMSFVVETFDCEGRSL